MASGDPVGQVLDILPPASSAATPDTRAGGSTPAETVNVWDFDDASDEYLDFKCLLTGYDGGGITVRLYWSATTATSGACRWGVAIRRVADDAEDIDGSHTYDFNTTGATAASASGEVDYIDITFTNGADMDSWADGEIAIVRVFRDGDGTSGTDDMSGDAELWGIRIIET